MTLFIDEKLLCFNTFVLHCPLVNILCCFQIPMTIHFGLYFLCHPFFLCDMILWGNDVWMDSIIDFDRLLQHLLRSSVSSSDSIFKLFEVSFFSTGFISQYFHLGLWLVLSSFEPFEFEFNYALHRSMVSYTHGMGLLTEI